MKALYKLVLILTVILAATGFVSADSPQISSFAASDLSGHAFNVDSLVNDPDGESNIQDCQLYIADGDGNSDTRTINNPTGGSNSTDAECDFGPINYSDNAGWSHTESMNLEITVSDNDGNSDIQTLTKSFPNHQPSLSVSFQNYSSRHAFNATAVITDTDAPGDTEIDFCSMNFSDSTGNYIYVEPSVNQGYGIAEQASCIYSDINSSISGFDVTEDITVEVNATDVHGSTKVSTFSNPVPNRPPSALNPEPRDAGVVTSFPVKLNATVQDPEGDGSLDVTLYNDSLDAISSASGISSGYTVQGEQKAAGGPGKTYTWKVELSDTWGVQNTTFTFIELIGAPYRSSVAVNLNYSAVVLNAGDEEYVGLTVRNNVDNTKNLTVNLTGIKAEFIDGKKVKNFPNFQGRTQKQFTVRLTPDEATDKDLIVKLQNNEIGITTEKKLSVTTRENTRAANPVPGISLIQLLILFFAATVLYSVRL